MLGIDFESLREFGSLDFLMNFHEVPRHLQETSVTKGNVASELDHFSLNNRLACS